LTLKEGEKTIKVKKDTGERKEIQTNKKKRKESGYNNNFPRGILLIPFILKNIPLNSLPSQVLFYIAPHSPFHEKFL
jgi:hypothetical protein